MRRSPLAMSVQESINHILWGFLSSRTEEDLGKLCLSVAQELTGSKFGRIAEIRPDGLMYDIATSHPGRGMCGMRGGSAHSTPSGNFAVHGLYGFVLNSGKSMYTNAPGRHPRGIGLPEGHPPLTSFLGVPLENEGTVLGIIALGNRRNGFTNRDVRNVRELVPAIVEAFSRKRSEDALRRSETKLFQAQRIAHLGYWERNLKTGQSHWSEEIYNILGLKPGTVEESYERFLESVHPEDRKIIQEAAQFDRSEPRDTVELEYRIVRPDGSVRIVVDRAETLLDHKKDPATIIGATLDITEHKKVEEILRRNEEELRSALSEIETYYATAPIGLAVLDTHLRYIRINERLAQLNGVPVPDHIGRTLSDVVPALAGKMEETLAEVLKSGASFQNIEIAGETSADPGKVHTWRTDFYPIKNGNGKIVAINVAVEDITERKRTEEFLRNSHEHLQMTSDAAGIGIWEWDIASGGLTWDDKTRRMYGVPPDAPVTYDTWEKSLHPMDAQAVGEAVAEAITGRGDYVAEFRITLPDGAIRWVHSRGKPSFDGEGKAVSMSGIAFDVTDLKHAEEELRRSRDELEIRVAQRTMELRQAYDNLQKESQEREHLEDQLRQAHKMEAIGTMAGGIAHDFNNILASIVGFTEMAIDDVSGIPEVQRYLKNVFKSALRGRDLVKQILTFSRKTDCERHPVSVIPVIEETLQLLRASISANIEIMVSISATSDTVVADTVEIQQILMNLATNAALAMRERGGTLDIGLCDADLEAGPGMHPREHLQLVVKDTGTGMGSDVLEKIFDPFFTTRDRDKGTGMGLSVVYGIVQSLQGIITVESEPGHGSVFRVNLPKAADLPGRDATSNLVLEGAERILFVDDEEALVEWGRAALIRHGYTVTATSSPREALKMFASNPLQYDLIITDQAMPGMTGMELSKRLLSLRPDVPIILCTGHSDSLTTETMKGSGIREFLVKPVLRQELVKTIHLVFKGPVRPPASPV